MLTIQQLSKKTEALSASRISVTDFEDWLVDSLRDDSSDDPAQALVFLRLEGILAEASHSHWSDDHLAAELANAVRVAS